MANPDNCPNCDNIYGNEPRKIPCGHIVCHKCCLDLFNKENNTLICPVCDKTHPFKSKNIFKKSLLQVAHAGFGKKTSGKDLGFASIMPMEKASGIEKSMSKELKKATANPTTPPPSAPPANPPVAPTSTNVSQSVPLVPVETSEQIAKILEPAPMPLMATRSALMDSQPLLVKPKVMIPNGSVPPSLLQTLVTPPVRSNTPIMDAVTARCHSCGNKRQVIVCEHCDHFVCLKCAEEHTAVKVDRQSFIQKWNECEAKYNKFIQALSQYENNKNQIERDLAAIRVAVEQRTRDATEAIKNQQRTMTEQIEQHINEEKKYETVTHHDLCREYQTIQNRLRSAQNGDYIGPYSQEDFLRDISQFQTHLQQRKNLVENHVHKIPTISCYEPVSIERLLGELCFNNQFISEHPQARISMLLNHEHSTQQNGFDDHSVPVESTPVTKDLSTNSFPWNKIAPIKETMTVKPLMSETHSDTFIDTFEKFRRMAAEIHHKFNAPYSKVINVASTLSTNSTIPGETSQVNGNHERNGRPLPNGNGMKTVQMGSFLKSWKIEHTAVPNFLCMTPTPTPKVFVVDKYGKVSVSSIPPKPIKPIESYSLFAPGSDECIESVVASSNFLIVYSRKRQDTMTGTLYFFTHDCKPVPPLTGIHQSIPVHHILCDQNANRLYCLDRMRFRIYYHPLPNSAKEIENCMKSRYDFIQINPNLTAFKMVQNDSILGFYVKNHCSLHLYDKQKAEKIDELKCDHFVDKFDSWGIIAIRKDNTTLIFKVDESGDPESTTRQHIVYEVDRKSNQVISRIQLSSVFGMILGPSSEVILGIRQTKDSGVVQCYVKR